MPRKSGGPPENRTEEEPWQPPGAEEPLQRSMDLALQRDDEEEEPEFIYGDIVHDTEADEPIPLVVVNIPGFEVQGWQLEDGTLADRFEKYPDDDYVVVVVRLDVLKEEAPDWDDRTAAIPMEELLESEFPIAPFPSLRLVRVEDSHLRGD